MSKVSMLARYRFLLAVLLFSPLGVAGWILPFSSTTRLLLFFLGGGLLAAILPTKYHRFSRYPGAVFISLAVVVVCSRLMLAPAVPLLGGSGLIPSGEKLRRINALFPERDLVMVGAVLLPLIGGIFPLEAEELPANLGKRYDELEHEQGVYTSPLIASIFGLNEKGVETLSFCSDQCKGNPNHEALLFLHGSAGNFSLLCWIVSKSVSSLGARTVCPSHNFFGNWGTSQGMEKVHQVILRLEEEGIKKGAEVAMLIRTRSATILKKSGHHSHKVRPPPNWPFHRRLKTCLRAYNIT